ncbi:MAG TPA: ADP-ribosylglycohydrolase family protein [Actinophytocola sp.]|uniref:ADP-ribosylglycohydrolase family protein n=1 Tax=Actinophytocola sp. TaxID=1872138 RepID=UPI002DC0200E|nr:ADP-ribosylglycohydrolase family protein [Actinophytocola sp.]HEU5475302.1 ADP-ribosylglycohydrolase family protein [Actinophytocola sp.]
MTGVDQDQVLGSIMAGAVGDALGGPVEFLSIEQIRQEFGAAGATDFVDEYGGRGRVTDDTQMTLFTMEGLVRASVGRRRGGGDLRSTVQHAYQRWLHTQGVAWERARGKFDQAAAADGWLVQCAELHARRAPGNTVLGALTAFASGAPSPSPTRPANDSKGCGAVMRSAPVALWADSTAEVFSSAAELGALTHGHPSGYLSAGALAVIVHQILRGADLLAAVDVARAELSGWPDYGETDQALVAAVRVAAEGRPAPETIESRLGGGWVGEEALAIGVCAALVSRDLADGLLLAVNHSGDSDSTGSICGNILGARDGIHAIPHRWLAELELRDVTKRLTLDLLTELGPNPPDTTEWHERYPAW